MCLWSGIVLTDAPTKHNAFANEPKRDSDGTVIQYAKKKRRADEATVHLRRAMQTVRMAKENVRVPHAPRRFIARPANSSTKQIAVTNAIVDALVLHRTSNEYKTFCQKKIASANKQCSSYHQKQLGQGRAPLFIELAELYIYHTRSLQDVAPIPNETQIYWAAKIQQYLLRAWTHFVDSIYYGACQQPMDPAITIVRISMAVLYKLKSGMRVKLQLPQSGGVWELQVIQRLPELACVPPLRQMNLFMPQHGKAITQRCVSHGNTQLNTIFQAFLAHAGETVYDTDELFIAAHQKLCLPFPHEEVAVL